MKKILIAFLTAFFLGSGMVSAQFWQGFLWGLANGMQQMQQQQYYNQNNRRQTEQRRKSEPIEETRKYESGGFVWTRMSQWNSAHKEIFYGAKDENGKIIIPLGRGYTFICYHDEGEYGGYFSVDKGNLTGICDRYGNVIFSPSENDYINIDGVFKRKTSSGDWVETTAYLDSDGRGHRKSSGSSSNWGNSSYYMPGIVNNVSTTEPSFNLRGNGSSSSGNRAAETLNQTVGEKCMTCNGTGKCHACNGTKVASSFGNTYQCTVCDANGNCPSCKGTGKASWNR